MYAIYVCLCRDIDVCFMSTLVLLHYCFTPLYKCITPAFTPAVLIHMLYFCMLTPQYIIYVCVCVCIYIYMLYFCFTTLYILN
jgi:hypothetical protein